MTPSELLKLSDINFLQAIVKRYEEMQYIAGKAESTPEGTPKLHKDAIIYKVFPKDSIDESAIEAERTLVGLLCFKWTLNNEYDKLTGIQPSDSRLTADSFAKLRKMCQEVATTEHDLEFCLYSIACNDLGKTLFYIKQYKILTDDTSTPDHDLLLNFLLQTKPELFPAFGKILSKEQHTMYIEGLNANLNLGQMVQGENFPYNLQAMQAISAKSRNLRLISELFDFAGILGHVNASGSLIMTEDNFQSYSLAITELMAEPKEQAYQRYISKRASSVGLEVTTAPESYAIARLLAMARVFKREEAAKVIKVWQELPQSLKALLTRELNLTGLTEEPGILLYYAPALIANAIKGLGDYEKGLRYALDKFAENYQKMRKDVSIHGSGVITVNIAEAAREALALKAHVTVDDKQEKAVAPTALVATSPSGLASANGAEGAKTVKAKVEHQSVDVDNLSPLFEPPAPVEPFRTCLYRSVIADKELATNPPLCTPDGTTPPPAPNAYDNTMQVAYEHAEVVAREHPNNPLAKSLESMAAIHIYTQEYKPEHKYSVYFLINQLFYNANERRRIYHWRDYVYVLGYALMMLPPLSKRTLYRGVARELPKLEKGQELVWHAITSTTSALPVAIRFLDVENKGAKTIFTVTTKHARDVKLYSAYGKGEREATLPMQMQLAVTDVDFVEEDKMTQIQIQDKEGRNPIPLLAKSTDALRPPGQMRWEQLKFSIKSMAQPAQTTERLSGKTIEQLIKQSDEQQPRINVDVIYHPDDEAQMLRIKADLIDCGIGISPYDIDAELTKSEFLIIIASPSFKANFSTRLQQDLAALAADETRIFLLVMRGNINSSVPLCLKEYSIGLATKGKEFNQVQYEKSLVRLEKSRIKSGGIISVIIGKSEDAVYKRYYYRYKLSNVLFPDNLIEREQLKELDSLLTPYPKTAAIIGEKGVGKSSLAYAYAARHQQDYDFIRVINGKDLSASLSSFAADLGIKAANQLAMTMFASKLKKASRYLIIIDNIDDDKAIEEFLPQLTLGHCIITTNNALLSLSKIILPKFTPSEASLFLNQELGKADEAGLLISELGCSPYVLSLAVNFIKEHFHDGEIGHNIKHYLEQRRSIKSDNPQELALQLVLPRLKTTAPQAVKLLNLCALLGDNIPLELFSHPKLLENTDKVYSQTTNLSSAALVMLNEQALSVVARELVVKNLHERKLKPSPSYFLTSYLLPLKDALLDFYAVFPKSKAMISAAIELRHHLQNCAVGEVRELWLIDNAKADLALIIGKAYKEHGDYAKSKEFLEEALGIYKAHLGNLSANYIETLVTLADFETDIPIKLNLLAIASNCVKMLAGKETYYALLAFKSAQILAEQGNLAKALELASEALGIIKQHNGKGFLYAKQLVNYAQLIKEEAKKIRVYKRAIKLLQIGASDSMEYKIAIDAINSHKCDGKDTCTHNLLAGIARQATMLYVPRPLVIAPESVSYSGGASEIFKKELDDISFLQAVIARYQKEAIHLIGPGEPDTSGTEVKNKYELKKDSLTYKVFTGHDVNIRAEVAERTLVCLLCLKWVWHQDYDKFTAAQINPRLKLTRVSFNKLHEYTRQVIKDDSDLEMVLYSLAINNLGKTLFFINKHKEYYQKSASDHDERLYQLIIKDPTLFPSFMRLSPKHQDYFLEGRSVDFNLGQLVQGENLPFNLVKMQQIAAKSRELRLLCNLFNFAGVLGHIDSRGSRLMTEENYLAYSAAIKELTTEPYDAAYLRYITWRGELAGVVVQEINDDGYVLGRIVALSRSFSLERGGEIQEAWEELAPDIKQIVRQELMATGIDAQQAILLYYAPQVIENAIKRLGFKAGLKYALSLLAEEYHKTRAKLTTPGPGVETVVVKTIADKVLMDLKKPSIIRPGWPELLTAIKEYVQKPMRFVVVLPRYLDPDEAQILKDGIKPFFDDLTASGLTACELEPDKGYITLSDKIAESAHIDANVIVFICNSRLKQQTQPEQKNQKKGQYNEQFEQFLHLSAAAGKIIVPVVQSGSIAMSVPEILQAYGVTNLSREEDYRQKFTGFIEPGLISKIFGISIKDTGLQGLLLNYYLTNVPRAPKIIGRDKELSALKIQVSQKKACFLIGETGVGKSALALNLAHSFKGEYQFIRYFKVEAPDDWDLLLEKLAADLGVNRFQVANTLLQLPSWLLIIDSNNISVPWERMFCRLGDKQRLLIIQRKAMEVTCPHILLQPLSKEALIQIVQAELPDSKIDECHSLVEIASGSLNTLFTIIDYLKATPWLNLSDFINYKLTPTLPFNLQPLKFKSLTKAEGDLKQAFEKDDAVIITGDAGSGKTVLAQQYAKRNYRDNYIILDAANGALLTSLLASGCLFRDDLGLVIKSFKDKISNSGKLLIIDDVQSWDEIKSFFPLPAGVKMLITSRNGGIKLPEIKLSPWTKDEALSYMQQALDDDEQTLQKLLIRLDGSPLTLTGVINFIRHSQELDFYAAADFMLAWEKTTGDALSLLCKMIIERVTTFPVCLKILRAFKFLDNAPISPGFFNHLSFSDNIHEVYTALHILSGFGLLTPEQELKISPLGYKVIATIDGAALDECLPLINTLTKDIEEKIAANNFSVIKVRAHLLKLYDLLQSSQLPQYGLLSTKLLQALAKLSNFVRDYVNERQYLEQILVINEKSFGKTHLEYAKTLSDLGSCYCALGMPEAVKYLEASVAIIRNFYHESDIEYQKYSARLQIVLERFPAIVASTPPREGSTGQIVSPVRTPLLFHARHNQVAPIQEEVLDTTTTTTARQHCCVVQ